MLFGDSSFIVHYLKRIGWNLNKVEQTGSNFGTNSGTTIRSCATSAAARWSRTGCR